MVFRSGLRGQYVGRPALRRICLGRANTALTTEWCHTPSSGLGSDAPPLGAYFKEPKENIDTSGQEPQPPPPPETLPLQTLEALNPSIPSLCLGHVAEGIQHEDVEELETCSGTSLGFRV